MLGGKIENARILSFFNAYAYGHKYELLIVVVVSGVVLQLINQFVSAYDSIADWPDRPDNWMSLLNAVVGLATGHTAVAFTNPSNVPPQNIATTVNSRGAKTTTYLIPETHLPLVLPFLQRTASASAGGAP